MRDVFEASPEGCLERGVFFNAGCGSESENESKGEKDRAEIHFWFEKILEERMRGKRWKGCVFRLKVVVVCCNRGEFTFALSNFGKR